MGILADGSSGGVGAGGLILYLVVVYAIYVLPLWFIFKKAGKTEWHALIPIYNTIVLLEIVGRPVWWVILLLIPCVSFIVWIFVAIDLAKSFGRGTGFAVGLIFLGLIWEYILAFGSDTYRGPAGPLGSGQAPPPAVA